MKLEPYRHRDRYLRARMTELVELTSAATAEEGRPCERCEVRCRCPKRSRSCACMCRPDCVLAPRMLSSDQSLPLERGIVPIVYELNSLKVVQTCWSCEGHEDERRRLTKAPRVWFYSPSITYTDLINEHVQALGVKKLLRRPWQLTMVGRFGPAEVPRFTLQPVPVSESERQWVPQETERSILDEMRGDLVMLTRSLRMSVQSAAMKELAVLRKHFEP